MKHTIGVGDDYLIRQSPTRDGYGIRSASAAAGYTRHDFEKM
jgi:hypothetical protein